MIYLYYKTYTDIHLRKHSQEQIRIRKYIETILQNC